MTGIIAFAGEPYPALTRRAQFLIEHEWFIEADEHLPTYKDPPMSGGDYPFRVTSEHNRWSIHSLNTANELMLEADVEPGMIKWLHLAGGYGHLRYWVTEWQPSAVMRGTRVGIEKV